MPGSAVSTKDFPGKAKLYLDRNGGPVPLTGSILNLSAISTVKGHIRMCLTRACQASALKQGVAFFILQV